MNLINNNKTFIIAEAGCNHNGKISIAFKLIDAAKKSGANAVKFQIFNPISLVSKNASKAPYSKNNVKNEKQLQMQKKISLNFNQFLKLQKYAVKKKIHIFYSVFDDKSLLFLKKLKVNIIKIPSGEINNIPFLKNISKLNKEIILSTGMAEMKEIYNAVKVLKKNTKLKKINILHCVSLYPTKINELNLLSIKYLKSKFMLNIGLSDHSTSIIVPSLAVCMGAKIIEKHITLNKKLKGPDHFMSLDPKEFRQMVDLVRKTELSLGKFEKKPSSKEKKIRLYARKSIVAKKIIKKGEIFTKFNLTLKRPGNGIEPNRIGKFYGRKSKCNYKIDDLIK